MFFRRVRKVAKSYITSSYLSVRPHGTTRLPLEGFKFHFKFDNFFQKTVEKIQVLLKSDKILST